MSTFYVKPVLVGSDSFGLVLSMELPQNDCSLGVARAYLTAESKIALCMKPS
jgi:hypothetical protein